MIQPFPFFLNYIYMMDYYLVIKKGNSAICDNIDKPAWHYTFYYVKYAKQRKTSTVGYHLYLESKKKTNFIET